MGFAYQNLELRPWQQTWGAKILHILSWCFCYLDYSLMGSGKTIIALWVALQLNLPIFVVAPSIMCHVWSREAEKHGVEVISVMSYGKLRSKKYSPLKHDFLVKTVNKNGQVNYTASDTFMKIIDEGVLVIFDEVSELKNQGQKHKACCAITNAVVSRGGQSRFALLSASPIDNYKQIINLLRLMGIIKSSRLYHCVKGECVLDAMQQLVDICKIINPTATLKCLENEPARKANMVPFAYNLYCEVLKSEVSGAAGPPVINVPLDIKNGFYKIESASKRKLEKAVADLAKATKYSNNFVQIDGNCIGFIVDACVRCEAAKIKDTARVARSFLKDTQKGKFIACMNYKQPIAGLEKLLKEYNPIILDGAVDVNKRQDLIKKFNEDPDYRVLIMNTAVGAMGIELDDKIGDSPRFMIIMPTFDMLRTLQARNRVYRDGTKSAPIVRMFYGDGLATQETAILNAMAQKSDALRGMLDDSVIKALRLPGEYDSFYE